MKLTTAAIKNHEELFPGHISTLQQTNPEFIELFDDFAFDEVIVHDRLDVKTRVMMILASTLGSNVLTEYKVIVGGALNVGVTPVEIKEILYQAIPFIGVTKGIDFLFATNELLASREISLPLNG